MSLTAGWAWGCLYLAAYGCWAWFFRSSVDRWARRALGGRLGVKVTWVRATTFPLEIWVWGLAGSGGAVGGSLLESRVALGSAATCLAGAFIPTTALCLMLRWGPPVSAELGPALYLMTPLLLLLFVASHLKWRAPLLESSAEGKGRDGEGHEGPTPSGRPGKLGAGPRPQRKKCK